MSLAVASRFDEARLFTFRSSWGWSVGLMAGIIVTPPHTQHAWKIINIPSLRPL